MGVQQLTLPGEIVKKHNEFVRSKIDIDDEKLCLSDLFLA